MAENDGCSYPGCPGKENQDDLKDRLDYIRNTQERHHESMEKLGGILESIANVKKDIDRNDKAHENLFQRIGDLEHTVLTKNDVTKLFTVLGVCLVVVQIAISMIQRLIK